MSPVSSVALTESPLDSGLGTANFGERHFDMRTEAKASPDRKAAPLIASASDAVRARFAAFDPHVPQ
jgi:hypothetical protein